MIDETLWRKALLSVWQGLCIAIMCFVAVILFIGIILRIAVKEMHVPARWTLIYVWLSKRWKYLKYLIVTAGILLLTLICYGGIRWYGQTLDTAGAIQSAIYLATAIILAVYTLETYGVRQQMVRQYELELHPLVITTLRDNRDRNLSNPQQTLCVKNIGRSAALSIQVASLQLPGSGSACVEVAFDRIDCLEPGVERTIRPRAGAHATVTVGHHDDQRGTLGNFDLIRALSRFAAQKNASMVIRYADVNNGSHKSIMQ